MFRDPASGTKSGAKQYSEIESKEELQGKERTNRATTSKQIKNKSQQYVSLHREAVSNTLPATVNVRKGVISNSDIP